MYRLSMKVGTRPLLGPDPIYLPLSHRIGLGRRERSDGHDTRRISTMVPMQMTAIANRK